MDKDEKAKFHQRPACCPPEAWEDWSMPAYVDPANSFDWICGDCNPAYKAKMMAQGKCDWPCVEFFLMPIIDNGRVIGNEIQGRRMSIPNYRGYPEGRKIIRIVDAKKGVYELEPEKPR